MDAEFDHFLDAQADFWPAALKDIDVGRKTADWAMFFFPRTSRLGYTPEAHRFGLEGGAEVLIRFLQHPVLGPRLVTIAEALVERGLPLHTMLGETDAELFRSCIAECGDLARASWVEKVLAKLPSSPFSALPDTARFLHGQGHQAEGAEWCRHGLDSEIVQGKAFPLCAPGAPARTLFDFLLPSTFGCPSEIDQLQQQGRLSDVVIFWAKTLP